MCSNGFTRNAAEICAFEIICYWLVRNVPWFELVTFWLHDLCTLVTVHCFVYLLSSCYVPATCSARYPHYLCILVSCTCNEKIILTKCLSPIEPSLSIAPELGLHSSCSVQWRGTQIEPFGCPHHRTPLPLRPTFSPLTQDHWTKVLWVHNLLKTNQPRVASAWDLRAWSARAAQAFSM